MKLKGFLFRSGAPKWAVSALLGALALTALTARSEPALADPAPRCGAPGKPACPMQRWMRSRLATALAHKDLKALAEGLEALVALNPEPKKWRNWDKFANDGARAAREGRARSVIASCAHCHSIYRPEYNVKYRTRRVSAPADLPRTNVPAAPARD